MGTATISPRPSGTPTAAAARIGVAVLRRHAGGWALIAALAALPVYYGVSDLVNGYQAGVVAGHPVVHHDLSKLGSKGNDKSAVLSALFSTTNRNSVLGTYGFDKNGDTTLKSYGLYKVAANGDPVFFKTITPTKTVAAK